jgi:hypothetical protein
LSNQGTRGTIAKPKKAPLGKTVPLAFNDSGKTMFHLFSCLLPEPHCHCFSFFDMCAVVRARHRMFVHYPPSISQKQKWIYAFFFILWA